MLLHSHVSWGISLDFSLSGTLADMFNKHGDPFPAQSSGCLCGSMSTVQFRLFRGEERRGKIGKIPGLEKKPKELRNLNRHLIYGEVINFACTNFIA